MENSTHELPQKLDGTTPLEVFSLTFFVPMCSIIMWLTVGIFQLSKSLARFVEVLLLNLVLLLALTLLESHHGVLLAVLGVSVLLLAYVSVLKSFTGLEMKYVLKDVGASAGLRRDASRDAVGGYRGHLLLATSICILAVDFGVFPSRFAKTETYGWSVMDAGVGSFVLLHGLCSSHGKHPSSTRGHGLKKCFLSSFPLFLLGFIRLIVTNAVGYHKVIPEYGVHWNFFFTLGFTKVVCPAALDAVSAHAGLLAAAFALMHQYLLSGAGLSALVLNDSRANFFEANKEGICSLPGFLCLYFCGVQMGRLVWRERVSTRDQAKLLISLVMVGLCGWLLMLPLHHHVQPVSRRMANLPYCVWVVSLTSLQIALHLLQEMTIGILSKLLKNNYCEPPFLWRVINYNGLFYFLFANLITGLVNVAMSTDTCPDRLALLVLGAYLALLTAGTALLHARCVQLKFW